MACGRDAWGVGVYHFFRDNEVTVPSGIVVPDGLVDRIRSPLSVYLSGEGTMEHIINDKGNWTSSKGGGRRRMRSSRPSTRRPSAWKRSSAAGCTAGRCT